MGWHFLWYLFSSRDPRTELSPSSQVHSQSHQTQSSAVDPHLRVWQTHSRGLINGRQRGCQIELIALPNKQPPPISCPCHPKGFYFSAHLVFSSAFHDPPTNCRLPDDGDGGGGGDGGSFVNKHHILGGGCEGGEGVEATAASGE